VNDAFQIYLEGLIPSASEREKASSHRASIEAKLQDKFGLIRMYESGSWKHGTGVTGFSDVDYFISLKSAKPVYGNSALTAVKDAMQERYPNTYIHTSRPAVVLEFGSGYERVELIPAYPCGISDSKEVRYYIPGVRDEWMESTPEAHLKYVSDCNEIATVKGGAKGLARLMKAWKYHRKVPISSFYLEMRASEYMATQSSIIYPLDFLYFLNSLKRSDLAAMNDPTGSTGRIYPCSSEANLQNAISILDTTVTRATKAVDLDTAGKVSEAFETWDLVFAGSFPAYY
jgi:hypothetical protein